MNLLKKFECHLKEELQVSGKTLRNYRADLAHFTSWAISHLHSSQREVQKLEQVVPYFTSQLVAAYKTYHLENQTPESTINRRLSTLRNFARYLTAQGMVAINPAEMVSNVKPLVSWSQEAGDVIEEFKKYLEREKVAQATLKNYVSDIRQFLNWVPADLSPAGPTLKD